MSTRAVQFTTMVASMVGAMGALATYQDHPWARWLTLVAFLVAWICSLISVWRLNK